MNEHFFTNKFGIPKNADMTVIFSIIKKSLNNNNERNVTKCYREFSDWH